MRPAKSKVTSQGGASKTVDKFSADPHHLDFEGIDATVKRSGRKLSVGRKKGRPGKKRRARSLGRYPFLAWINKYLENSGLAEVTIVERRRRLKRIYRELLALEAEGEINTTNPEKMKEKDVGTYVESLIKRGKKGKDFEHDITALNALLKCARNLELDLYRNSHANQFRKTTKVRRLPSFEGGEFDLIIQSANKIDQTDWNMIESFAIVILGLASGARHKELKEGKISDLCLKEGGEFYHIEHPKGEDTYGDERDPPLRRECAPFLRKYLKIRHEKQTIKPDNLFLFPALRDNVDGKLSTNSITKMVRSVGENAHVKKLDLHKCRRTYGQMLLDEGMATDEASVLMGHASTATTERYYCRKKQQQASAKARNIWDRNVSLIPVQKRMPDVKNPLIDEFNDDTGFAY